MADNDKKKFHPGFLKNLRSVGYLIAAAIAAVIVAIWAARNRTQKGTTMDVPPVDMRAGTQQTAESERYRQVLDKTNKDGFKEAAKESGTFIPALSDRNAKTTNLEQELQQRAQSEPEKKRIDYAHPNGAGAAAPAGQQAAQPVTQPSPGLQDQLNRLAIAWGENSQQLLGGYKDKPVTTPSAGAQSGLAPSTSQTSAAAAGAAKPMPYIGATDLVSADLISAVDTDDGQSDVIAECNSGKYEGSKYMGTAKLVNEAVRIEFTMMRLPASLGGRTIKINAVAVTEKDMRTALPADIDHRYGQRVGIPALLGALSAAGTVYANAGSTVQNTPLGGVTTTTNPNPTGRQLAGAAVSGGLQATQQVIQQESAAIPPKRGRIPAEGKGLPVPIGILFREDVVLQ